MPRRWHDEAGRERDNAHTLFEHGMDLSNRLERLNRELAAELARPWWRRLWGRR